jgi:hypothetical protein
MEDVNAKSEQQTVIIETPSEEQTAKDNITRAFKLKEKPAEEQAPVEVSETQAEKKEEPAEVIAQPEQVTETPLEVHDTVPIPDEDKLDQATKTWLGRKVAEQTDKKINPLLEKIALLENELLSARTPKAPSPVQEQPVFDPDEPIYTKGEVLNLVQQSERMKATAQQNYVRAYVGAIETLAKEDDIPPDVKAEMWRTLDEVMKNPISHQNPHMAATKNYSKALRTVILQKQTKPEAPKVPVGGEPPISATGLSVGTSTETSKPTVIKVDDKTRQMMKSFNLGDDWVQKRIVEKR